MTRDGALNVAVGLLTLSAVTTTVLLVRRELFSTPASAPAPRQVRDWQRYALAGHRLGSSKAPVTIVVFSDYQCPFCAALSKELRMIRQAHGDDVSVVYRNYPLAIHPFAQPAVRASECAAAQGRFESFHNVLFERQDSIGLMPWTEFARRANVSDLGAFESCVSHTTPVMTLARDSLDAKRLRIRATPTFLINATLVQGLPPVDTLTSLIGRALRSGDH